MKELLPCAHMSLYQDLDVSHERRQTVTTNRNVIKVSKYFPINLKKETRSNYFSRTLEDRVITPMDVPKRPRRWLAQITAPSHKYTLSAYSIPLRAGIKIS
ncbi:hypothetical protein AG1IA_09694 [Rhizoctonia solani AG-1 IA]|uniref:Uncharacterized protein n=1 Tax=Thanatephorus cucumeris (strain AG1-IA) TaxID=983506 RepID=L8WIW6_THACA|nr:hypothetical protein AG1IA_09694 [Rhizoctonia solani AG-1 IA]